MNHYKLYYPSTMFSGEIIINTEKGYKTKEEAKEHTDVVYPDVDWEEYDEHGHFVCASYQ